MTWSPGQYLRFAGPRLRPAADLLARVPLDVPGRVFDLGCGTGATTALLAARFPRARITGIDSSGEMLAAARAEHPGLSFEEHDIAAFSPSAPADLVFSNAALQWLPGHERLMPTLMGCVKGGGVLAVQVPRVEASPRVAVLHELADDPRWRDRLVPLLFPGALDPAAYYGLLAPLAAAVDIWETEYLHVLEGDNPVVEWSVGSAAAPLVAALNEEERTEFLARYRARMGAAYPRRPDGRTLLPFRRLFLVAVRN